jgi:hypothetical protein
MIFMQNSIRSGGVNLEAKRYKMINLDMLVNICALAGVKQPY